PCCPACPRWARSPPSASSRNSTSIRYAASAVSDPANAPPSSTDLAERRGRLVVISGPSGVGKSTVVRRLRDEQPFAFSISATTRPRRPDEVDGVHYHFLDRDA